MNQLLRSFLVTTDDRVTLLSELDAILQAKFITKKDALEDILASKVRSDVAAILPELWKDKDPYLLLKDLKNEVNGLPVIRLSLAFSPTRVQLEHISQKLEKEDKKTFYLIEISVMERIVGGAEISVNGVYKDYTIATKLRAFLTSKGRDVLDSRLHA